VNPLQKSNPGILGIGEVEGSRRRGKDELHMLLKQFFQEFAPTILKAEFIKTGTSGKVFKAKEKQKTTYEKNKHKL